MCAVHNAAVFCSSLISCFPGMLLKYYLSDFEMIAVTPVITGITFAFTFHMRWIIIIIIIIIIQVALLKAFIQFQLLAFTRTFSSVITHVFVNANWL
jgi:hypothetical protein